MTTHKMMFDPTHEPVWSPDRVATIDEILDYAERNYAFHSIGVCPGPKAMMRELVQVLSDGRGNTDYASVTLDQAVEAAFDNLDAAVDYGLHGLRNDAAAFSLWPKMARAYEQIAAIVEAWPSIDLPQVATLRETMRTHSRTLLNRTYLARELWRVSRESVYADMYRQCGRGLAGLYGASDLDVLLAPVWTREHRRTEAMLRDILRSRFGIADETSERFVQNLSGCIMDFLLREQAVLRTAAAVQIDINRLLGRDPPERVLCAADLGVHNLMTGFDSHRLPYLIDELERLLGIHISLDTDSLTVSRQNAEA